MFPKIGVGPPNPWNFHRVFHEINPSILGYPIFGLTPIYFGVFLGSNFLTNRNGETAENGEAVDPQRLMMSICRLEIFGAQAFQPVPQFLKVKW